MTIVSVGLSHRSTPPDVLEKLVVSAAQRDDMLTRLHAEPGIDEVIVLSTCNRMEVYVNAKGPVEQVTSTVAELVAFQGQLPVDEVQRMAQVQVDAAAAEHLFSVACGLDSMAVGEEQIVAQIKGAARAAAEALTTGPAVGGLMDAALRVSKRARTETTISTAGISLARAGLDLAQGYLGGLAGRNAVVLGTGSVGKLAARLLREAGVGRLAIASRSEAAAAKLAAAVDGTPLQTADLAADLADADILITATAAVQPVVLAEQVSAARTSNRPLIVLDLGMPRDVEPAVGLLAGVTLVDIPALGQYLADRDVPDDIPRVREIVAAELVSYNDKQNEAAAKPVIAALHAQIRQLTEAELVRLNDRLPNLSDEERAETAATVNRIIRKVLHRPTVRAKEFAGGPDGPAYLEALRQLFDLNT
ncbi:MAG TPA: glutamyl-tRNA reductase [Kribbella sp.]|jgi:glutamyl-tRNA reductase